MNRLVLIGNGFDLAHGLKTKYEHFIDWYWVNRVKHLHEIDSTISEDSLCKIESLTGNWSLVNFRNTIFSNEEWWSQIYKERNKYKNGYRIETTKFMENILKNIELKGWVDIENEYYKILIQRTSPIVNNSQKVDVKLLNFQLDYLKTLLIDYLRSEDNKKIEIVKAISDKINRPIKRKEIAVANNIYVGNRDLNDVVPNNIMLLSFNYTKTVQLYAQANSKVQVNYIHGNLNDIESVIFGYGDDLDQDYEKLKNLNDNDCLQNVKSIKYSEAENYRTMLEFINSEPFQVCIMGHSCGNSDRTLLNTLFEHNFCVSVKPYYHQKDDGIDTYLELVQNISRSFTDMKLMRDRVVNKTYCEPLT